MGMTDLFYPYGDSAAMRDGGFQNQESGAQILFNKIFCQTS